MPDRPSDAAATAAINAPEYWNRRFEEDWEERGGPDQTVFFARLAVQALPDFLAAEIRRDRLSIYDFGCALGDALPVLRESFPASAIAGGDVAASGIGKARATHPGFRFDVLEPDTPPPPADVVFCSNTLEHFADWTAKLDLLLAAATRHVVMLVPFAEEELLAEHEVRFGYAMMPASRAGMALSWLTTFDTARLPGTRWPGRQMLAVYSRGATAGEGARVLAEGDTVSLDARGLDPAVTGGMLLTLEAMDAAIRTLVADEESAIAREAAIARLTRQRDSMLERAAEHNRRLALREAELRREVEGPRLVLQGVLQSRSWRTMQTGIARLHRLRGVPYVPPALPPLGDLSIPRIAFEEGPDAARPVPAPPPRKRAAGPPARPAPRRPAGPPALVTAATLHRGGVEQVVVDLAIGLRDLGRAVVVCVAETGGDGAETLRQAGIEVLEFGGDADRFAGFLEERRPAFALANHSYFGLARLGSAGVPIVEVVHNYYTWHQAAAPEYRQWVKPVGRFAAVSSGVADFHSRCFGIPPAAITVVNNPINRLGLLRPEPDLLRRMRHAPDGRFTFVNVAQFFPAKAHALLLSAFAEVHARHPHTRLRLIGEPIDPAVARLVQQEIARSGLQSAVELTGFIDRRALSHQLATSHAFVQPSVYEGFSVAMAEAAHFALPIVATRVGGAMDLVLEDDCGILIPPHLPDFVGVDVGRIAEAGLEPRPHNHDALVAAMERMVTARADWQERGFIGQRRIDMLTPRAVAQRYLDLVADLVGEVA
jgi:glycosyltransferase involved in cell wall biosynthesis